MITTKIATGQPTCNLGGVKEPSREQLDAMQQEQFIYHACAGQLEKIEVEKVLLPHDPQGHPQSIALAKGPDGAVYLNQKTIMCKSTDGGRTWDSYESRLGASANDSFRIRHDGTFIAPRNGQYKDDPLQLVVWASSDEGRTAEVIAEMPNLVPRVASRNPNVMAQLPDDTLVMAVETRLEHNVGLPPTHVYRSTDGGQHWSGPTGLNSGAAYIGGGCFETMIAPMISGKLMAVIRYHGPIVPHWPLYPRQGPIWYKSMFLADSYDRGTTWQNLRPLANVHGQCHGFALCLDDCTVIVTHDHRYPPGTPGTKVMISRDEGETWQDEAFYLLYGRSNAGFSQSVCLDDGVILTVGALSHEPEVEEWNSMIGNTEYWAIRWRPVG